ncbi:hypothetical protein ACFL0C_00620 [Patescibacteria group bacterium]
MKIKLVKDFLGYYKLLLWIIGGILKIAFLLTQIEFFNNLSILVWAVAAIQLGLWVIASLILKFKKT